MLDILKELVEHYLILAEDKKPSDGAICICDLLGDLDYGHLCHEILDILKPYAFQIDPDVEFTHGWKFENLSAFTHVSPSGWDSPDATKTPHEWRLLTLQTAVKEIENAKKN